MDSLDTLQMNASEKNLLESLGKKSIIDHFQPRENCQEKNLLCKATQVSLHAHHPQGVYDGMPPDQYWKTIAEKRCTALSDALVENESLYGQITMLTKENEEYKQALEEVNSFIEVCKELMQDDIGDAGIDVNDMSTFNGTHEDTKI